MGGAGPISLSGREVADQIPDRAYTTVLTILERLRRKKPVKRSTDGKVHTFSAAATRESYTASLMLEPLGSAQDRNAVLVRFAKTVSSAEAKVLRDALDVSRSNDREPLCRSGGPYPFGRSAARPTQYGHGECPVGRPGPRAGVAVWQAIGASSLLAGIGSGLCVAVERYHSGFLGGLSQVGHGVVSGRPLAGLGLLDALGLTLAVDLAFVFCCMLGAVTMRTVMTRTATTAAWSICWRCGHSRPEPQYSTTPPRSPTACQAFGRGSS